MLPDEISRFARNDKQYILHAALQQPDDYASWRDIYKDRRKEQLFAEREKPDWNPLRYTAVTSNDPQNDPFVQSYN